MRQTKVRSARNKGQRSELRTAVKQARNAPSAETLATAESLIDRAGRKRLIHPNTAARSKSRLAKLANKAR
jgi:small subunit ribosomal protein S20